mmetsp:Transcript_8293/g.9402  ORF Transcript_8293/g.9402 Transcript_8293/m.9402 type:complete len:83 (-) Transcript_8293:501-749(-)
MRNRNSRSWFVITHTMEMDMMPSNAPNRVIPMLIAMRLIAAIDSEVHLTEEELLPEPVVELPLPGFPGDEVLATQVLLTVKA